MILARVLSQQYLHPVLREQGGAYGGGASYDQTTGLFRFYSYRDPELIKTLDVFRAAGDWVNKHPVTHQEVEEAVLSIVSGIDAPGSPCRRGEDCSSSVASRSQRRDETGISASNLSGHSQAGDASRRDLPEPRNVNGGGNVKRE